jgi:hypothetical protein
MVRLITLVAGGGCLGLGIAFAIGGNDLWLIFVALGALLLAASIVMRVAPRRGESTSTAYTDADPGARRPPRGPPPGSGAGDT